MHFTTVHTSVIKKNPVLVIFCAISQIMVRIKWNQHLLLEEELHFMVKLPSFYSCTLYAPFTRTAHSEKKHQHASLEFIVNVVLLLWVATTIVMSCPHLTVGSSCRAPACGRGEGGFLTKECDTRLIFNDAALFHLTSNQEE